MAHSAVIEALEVLEAIQNQYQEGAQTVYADALLFKDDRPLREHIDSAIESLKAKFPSDCVNGVTLPRSQRRSYGENFLGNWVGFVGKHKMQDFGPGTEGRTKAIRWVNEL